MTGAPVVVVPDLDTPGHYFCRKDFVLKIDRSVTVQQLRDMARACLEAVEVIEAGVAL